MAIATLERTATGISVNLKADGGWVRASFTPKEWRYLVVQGSLLLGLPEPWKD